MSGALPPRYVGVDEVRAALRRACDAVGGQRAFAARARLSVGFVSDVLNGRTPPSERLAAALGLERVMLFRRLGECGRESGGTACPCGWPVAVDCALTGWPDPDGIGVPLMPGLSRFHWVAPADSLLAQDPRPVRWLPGGDGGSWDACPSSPAAFGQLNRYLGPALTPAEVSAMRYGPVGWKVHDSA